MKDRETSSELPKNKVKEGALLTPSIHEEPDFKLEILSLA